MTPTPTGLDGLVGTVAVLTSDALAHDALDHRDRTRHGPAGGGRDHQGPAVGAGTAGPRPPAEPDDKADPEGPA